MIDRMMKKVGWWLMGAVQVGKSGQWRIVVYQLGARLANWEEQKKVYVCEECGQRCPCDHERISGDD